MITPGEALYLLYIEAMGDQGVGIDEWYDLGEKEQRAWERLAEQVTVK